jgi:hypothetical protein
MVRLRHVSLCACLSDRRLLAACAGRVLLHLIKSAGVLNLIVVGALIWYRRERNLRQAALGPA